MKTIVEVVKANKGLIVKGLIGIGAVVTAVVVAGALKKDEPITMNFEEELKELEAMEMDEQPSTEE